MPYVPYDSVACTTLHCVRSRLGSMPGAKVKLPGLRSLVMCYRIRKWLAMAFRLQTRDTMCLHEFSACGRWLIVASYCWKRR